MENKDLSFEDAMSNLDKIVTELENGNLSLDDSVKKFEEGIELSKYCNEVLDNAEKKITILLENEDGSIKEEDFEV